MRWRQVSPGEHRASVTIRRGERAFVYELSVGTIKPVTLLDGTVLVERFTAEATAADGRRVSLGALLSLGGAKRLAEDLAAKCFERELEREEKARAAERREARLSKAASSNWEPF